MVPVFRRWKLLLALASTAVLAPAAPAAANFLPVGQWDLNENGGTVAHNDFSLSSGQGALSGPVTWSAGRFKSGLTFDGTTGVVDVPNSPSLEGSQVTVSAWVRNAGSPGLYRYIVAKGGNGCCTGSYGLYTGASGGLEFYVDTGQTTYVDSPDAGTGVWDGNWHNVVGTFDGTAVRVYVDGQQIASGSPDTTSIQYGLPSGNDLTIGNYPWCPNLGWVGDIDEVKVWNRALGPTEINLGYQASKPLPTWWPFDLIL